VVRGQHHGGVDYLTIYTKPFVCFPTPRNEMKQKRKKKRNFRRPGDGKGKGKKNKINRTKKTRTAQPLGRNDKHRRGRTGY